MRSYLYYLGIIILLSSCDEEADFKTDNTSPVSGPVTFLNDYSKIVETLTLRSDLEDTVYRKEYYLDDLGKVDELHFFNYNNPQYNFINKYTYDDDNRLIQSEENGVPLKKYVWSKDKVVIESIADGTREEITFSDQHITSFSISSERNRSFEYDEENLISVSEKEKLSIEFLDFKQDVINPYYYLKSIELDILQSVWLPISKNIHSFRRNQPYEGSDYSVSLKTYEYFYEIDQENRVVSVHDDMSLIYTTHFEYFK